MVLVVCLSEWAIEKQLGTPWRSFTSLQYTGIRGIFIFWSSSISCMSLLCAKLNRLTHATWRELMRRGWELKSGNSKATKVDKSILIDFSYETMFLKAELLYNRQTRSVQIQLCPGWTSLRTYQFASVRPIANTIHNPVSATSTLTCG